MDPVWLALPGFLIWSAVLSVPWRPWSTRESLDARKPAGDPDLSRVTVLIPARNEGDAIARTLMSVAAQGRQHRIVLVDDQSSDDTAAAARGCNLSSLMIIAGKPLASGWTGKLWALEQGREVIDTPYILLLDADIEMVPGTLPALLDKLTREELGLVSLMARLRMQGPWEKLLLPAFIYFFKLLYPFALANSSTRHVAAAAGGCILIRADVLQQLGGFTALKHELIDDCALARRFKEAGYRTWLGLTHSAISHRRYSRLRDVREMVARTAFAQLRYSLSRLLVCSAVLVAAFVLPVAALFQTESPVAAAGLVSLALMGASYIPVLRFYDLNPGWAAALPAAGVLYLLMTWTSAFRYWFGSGASWKNRHYGRPENA